MRRLHGPLTAIQQREPKIYKFDSGAQWTANPTDWVIYSGDQLVDVVPEADFARRYEDMPDGGVHLTRDVCHQIEATTGIGTTRSGADLLHAIHRLAYIAIGGVQVDFSPGQLEELKGRAGKRGLSVKQELERIVERIKDEIFYRS